MGDDNSDYKPMRNSVNAKDLALTLPQAVQASAASLRDQIRKIVGSEPIIEVGDEGRFTLATYGAGKYVQMASFSMAMLPGCCGVCVFYHASVATDFGSKGLGSLLLQLREEAARKAGYCVALATVLKNNEAERHILESHGNWQKVSEFKNLRTNNVVYVYTTRLR